MVVRFNKFRISLTAMALVLGIGAAFATNSNTGGLAQCNNNQPPADCPFTSSTDVCCYTIDDQGAKVDWSRLP